MKKRLSAFVIFILAISLMTGLAQTGKVKDVAKAAQQTATTKVSTLVDINSASKDDLGKLPGIGQVYSQKIIDGRPYAKKDQLISKKILPQATYDKIKDMIIAKQK
jgi:competence protein ComEA